MLSRLEKSLLGNWLGCVAVIKVLGCEDFTGFLVIFNLVTGACLGASMILGAEFVLLPILLALVT